jgi:hypothetical protein
MNQTLYTPVISHLYKSDSLRANQGLSLQNVFHLELWTPSVHIFINKSPILP